MKPKCKSPLKSFKLKCAKASKYFHIVIQIQSKILKLKFRHLENETHLS